MPTLPPVFCRHVADTGGSFYNGIMPAYTDPAFSRGNKKVGGKVWTWNLPAPLTCPGASRVCLAGCYALTDAFRMEQIKTRYKANLQRASSSGFVAWAVEQIRQNKISICRIHSSGDFFSVEYVQKWIAIATACPSVAFYAYSRSWAASGFCLPLLELGRLPNVKLWLSFDRSMTLPARSLPTCYLMTSDDDLPPACVPLVFRADPATRLTLGGRVCPHEIDPVDRKPFVKAVAKITCSDCRRCF